MFALPFSFTTSHEFFYLSIQDENSSWVIFVTYHRLRTERLMTMKFRLSQLTPEKRTLQKIRYVCFWWGSFTYLDSELTWHISRLNIAKKGKINHVLYFIFFFFLFSPVSYPMPVKYLGSGYLLLFYIKASADMKLRLKVYKNLSLFKWAYWKNYVNTFCALGEAMSF